MIRILTVIFICVYTAFYAFASDIRPENTVAKYFEGTDYELDVYTIKGRKDGNTIFIVGGIQGDEPGGYLSADSYANLRLEQGNLIIIPRANLKSVILFDRGPDGDMNRLFTDSGDNSSMDKKVVNVLMEYMAEADIFLNLHDGWGYHSPKYISSLRNPNRFGQSIIVDEDVFVCSNGTELNLKDMAEQVLSAANAKIDNKDYHLAYFNTNTSNPKGSHKDMKKTATWYALRKHCIPAFGIEASKNLKSVEDKVLYHNYAINEFMKQMDVIPEIPAVIVSPAKLINAMILVDGSAFNIKNGESLKVDKGAKVSVAEISSNYDRGISCDVIGYGNYNDLGKEFNIDRDTSVVFRKENKEFARVNIFLNGDKSNAEIVNSNYLFTVSVDGKAVKVKNGDTFKVNKGSVIAFVNFQSGARHINLPINLKGWVPSGVANSGDDRGYNIVVSDTSMKKSFSINGKGKVYPVVVNNIYGKEIARIFMEIE